MSIDCRGAATPAHAAGGQAPVTPIPAATVVPLRDGPRGLEVLLLQRNEALVFAPGAWVFPGGRIDAGDYAAGGSDERDAARAAACREAQEEAGLVLDPASCRPFSHWTTPPHQPRRFSTWFFLADARHCHAVQVDEMEIVDFGWHAPAAALQAAADGALLLIRPTITTLRELQDVPNTASALARATERPPQVFAPNR